jgi:hypothetical protein
VNDVSDKLRRLIHLPGSLTVVAQQVALIAHHSEISTQLLGRSLSHHSKALPPKSSLRDAEFRVYSQWGDDGIIQYLIQHVPLPSETFVEFGVQDYNEANTRFLLVNDNWRGMIIDGSKEFMDAVRRSDIYWRYDLTAVDAFITRDNINGLIRSAGLSGPIGILSVDIDGNDYWVWEAIDVVDPAIVIVEYNSVFGSKRAISVPYDPAFRRSVAHSSYLYWGCSLRALCSLAQRKGYVFVGCNSNGNNAYFVKTALAAQLKACGVDEGYVLSRFRESRDADGRLDFKAGPDRLAAIADMTVVDVESGASLKLRDL